jgi:hypothetical protein
MGDALYQATREDDVRVDLYTKVILTVIACCLVWLCLGGSGVQTSLQAESGGNRVILAGWVGPNGVIHQLPSEPLPMRPY